MSLSHNGTVRLPPWFRTTLKTRPEFIYVRAVVHGHGLNTVCESASCPNRMECWNSGTATFMILGNVCTRGCMFCNVEKGRPRALDPKEPERVAEAVMELGLSHAVITSVTRDDLEDGGASAFRDTIHAIRNKTQKCSVEVLIPDFGGKRTALETVLEAGPDVLNHNMETVPALYARVRPKADYIRSLDIIRHAADSGAVTKSGLMLGLGESRDEILSVMKDLRDAGCLILTIGQYLRPSKRHLPVVRYYSLDEFESLKETALSLGFMHVASGPRVRSSYRARAHKLPL